MASLGLPTSVAEIVKLAENFEYDPKITLRSWLRTADSMQKQVRVWRTN
jgi:hypothetical protein